MTQELQLLISTLVGILSLVVATLSLLRDFFNWGAKSWNPEYLQRIRRDVIVVLAFGVITLTISQYLQAAELRQRLEAQQSRHQSEQSAAQATQVAQVATISVLEATIRTQETAMADNNTTHTRQIATATALAETYRQQSDEFAKAQATLSAPRTAPVALAEDQLMAPESFDAGYSTWKFGAEWDIRGENGNQHLCGKSVESRYIFAVPQDSDSTDIWSRMRDYVFEVDIRPVSFSTKGACEVLFRRSDPSSGFYILYFKPTGVTVRQCANPSCDQQFWEASASLSIASGAWHTVFVQAEDADVLVLVDGRQVLRGRSINEKPYGDMSQPRGVAWLGVGPGAECCFDNIRVLKVQR